MVTVQISDCILGENQFRHPRQIIVCQPTLRDALVLDVDRIGQASAAKSKIDFRIVDRFLLSRAQEILDGSSKGEIQGATSALLAYPVGLWNDQFERKTYHGSMCAKYSG